MTDSRSHVVSLRLVTARHSAQITKARLEQALPVRTDKRLYYCMGLGFKSGVPVLNSCLRSNNSFWGVATLGAINRRVLILPNRLTGYLTRMLCLPLPIASGAPS